MPIKHSQKSASTNRNVHNKLLLGIPPSESASLLKKLEFVDFPRAIVLHDVGEPIKFAYFVNSGLASVLNVMEDGKVIEVGLAGSEGFVGLPLLAGLKTSAVRVIMQVAGSGYKIATSDFLDSLKKCPTLSRHLARFGQEMTFQAMQVAACNRLHPVDRRLAKWLLMSQDRLGGNMVPLTQDFLSHMLGTRRASVTVAAAQLQKREAISYHRGVVRVRNRRTLESASCECYSTMIEQFETWGREVEQEFPLSRRAS